MKLIAGAATSLIIAVFFLCLYYSAKWPTTKGTILESTIERVVLGRSGISHNPPRRPFRTQMTGPQ